MNITVTLNGTVRTAEVRPDTTLFDFLREQGCYSVKCGCETSNCGLCTVHLDGHPVLSCSVLAVRADGHTIDTLEGLQEEAAVRFLQPRPDSVGTGNGPGTPEPHR